MQRVYFNMFPKNSNQRMEKTNPKRTAEIIERCRNIFMFVFDYEPILITRKKIHTCKSFHCKK